MPNGQVLSITSHRGWAGASRWYGLSEPTTNRRCVAEWVLWQAMALVVGALLALAAGLCGRVSGLDRDRAFYPTVAIVIASYYSLFAVMGASTRALVVESLVGGAFLAVAVLGFRSSLWVVVVVLAAHGVFDLVHGTLVSNPGVPRWWPAFCLTYDVTASGYLAWLLASGRVRPAA